RREKFLETTLCVPGLVVRLPGSESLDKSVINRNGGFQDVIISLESVILRYVDSIAQLESFHSCIPNELLVHPAAVVNQDVPHSHRRPGSSRHRFINSKADTKGLFHVLKNAVIAFERQIIDDPES